MEGNMYTMLYLVKIVAGSAVLVVVGLLITFLGWLLIRLKGW